jgi:hypothetical protein
MATPKSAERAEDTRGRRWDWDWGKY